MSEAPFTLADVRRSYGPEKSWSEMQGDLVIWAVHRRLSFPLAWLLLRLRVPVLAVTLTSVAVAFATLAIALKGGPLAPFVVCALGVVYPVLDCVDGNMARTLGTTSRLGAVIDGTTDLFFGSVVLLSLGLFSERAGGLFGERAVEFALGFSVLVLLHRAVRETYAAQFAEKTFFSPTRPARIAWGDRVLMATVGLEPLYPIGIALGAAFGVLDRVLLAVGIYTAAIFTGAIAMTMSQAASADRELNQLAPTPSNEA